jgi:hypothetical protein
VLGLAGLTALTFVGIAVSNAAFSASTSNTNNTAAAAASFATPPPAPTGPLASRSNVTVLAGSGTAGSADATGTAASFNRPYDMVFDASGDMFVADYSSHLIRRITTAGVVTTFAGSGSPGGANGTGTAASFDRPWGLAFDAAGDLFVADRFNNRIRRITPAGVVTTFAGSGSPASTDGTGTGASINDPTDLALDTSGNLVVSEFNGQRLRRITPAGVVTTFVTGLAGPTGLTIDAAGNHYVADFTSHRVQRVSPAGVVTTLAGSGSVGAATGSATGAVANSPAGVALSSTGVLHLSESWGHRITRLTPAGTGALAVAWTAPSSNGGAPITDYLVEYRTSPSGSWTTFADGVSTATSTTITGLTNGTAYDVRISAINTTGTGTASTAVTATPGVAPDAPTSVLLTPGTTLLTATWTAPANNGGAAITDYVIEYRTNPSGTWTVFPDSVSTATTATITGLTAGTAYDVRIRALNTYDLSTPSVIATATPTGWTPAALGTNLSLWLDADEASTITLNGSTVSQWNDKSGNGRHATQGTASAQPAYTASGLNGRPVLTFDSTNDFLGTALTLPHPLSMYAVAQFNPLGGVNARAILGSGNLSYALGYLNAAPASNAYALWNPNVNGGAYINNTTGLGPVVVGSTTASNDENTWNTYVNGSNAGQTISDTGTPNAPSPILIGWTGNGSEYWSGPIAEVVVLSQTMTTADRQRVEGYLAHKWGLTANLPAGHPYTTTPP